MKAYHLFGDDHSGGVVQTSSPQVMRDEIAENNKETNLKDQLHGPQHEQNDMRHSHVQEGSLRRDLEIPVFSVTNEVLHVYTARTCKDAHIGQGNTAVTTHAPRGIPVPRKGTERGQRCLCQIDEKGHTDLRSNRHSRRLARSKLVWSRKASMKHAGLVEKTECKLANTDLILSLILSLL